MLSATRSSILQFIRQHSQARAHDLIKEFNLSRVTIHKHLKQLIIKGELQKIGIAPLVYYLIPGPKKPAKEVVLSPEIAQTIENRYLYISPQGDILPGLKGFLVWVNNTQQQDTPLLAKKYFTVRQEADRFMTKDGWIDAIARLRAVFPDSVVNNLYYQDFYSLPVFGKTKLGQLVLYAKQSQNRQLIKELVKEVKPIIEKIIAQGKIKAVAFIPPTVPRQLQFIQEFQQSLNLALPTIPLVKVRSGRVIVAQKTLSKLTDRIANARSTIFTKPAVKSIKAQYSNLLLIDDAVGSGATLNETAKKLKTEGWVSQKIIGFAIVGSYKGFDVISEI